MLSKRRPWELLVKLRCSRAITYISRRDFTMKHLENASQSLDTYREGIPYGDLCMLIRQRNKIHEKVDPKRSLFTIDHFKRNILQHYNEIGKTKLDIKAHPKANQLSELFILLLHLLHYASAFGSGTRIPKHVNHISHNIPRLLTIDESNEMKESPTITEYTQQLINLYHNGDSEASKKIVQKRLCTNIDLVYAGIRSHLDESQDLEDVMKWISSILAPNITDACFAIEGQQNVPNFVLEDILVRQPTSEYEFDLIYYLFKQYAENLSTVPMTVVKNIIFYGNRFNSKRLIEMTQLILSLENIATKENVNRLIPLLAGVGEPKNSREHHLSILSAQRLLVDFLINHGHRLSPLGYLGISYGLLPLSVSRAKKFYDFSINESLQTKEEHQLAGLISIQLSKSPQSLIQNFDDEISKDLGSQDPRLWQELLKGLDNFDLLNAENSEGFLNKLGDSQINEQQVDEAKAVLQKYQNVSSIFSTGTIFSNKRLASVIKSVYMSKDQFRIYDTGPDYARNLFSHLATPPRSIVGEVLLGESYHNPQNAYDLYKRLLEKHCEGKPNEKALLSLILPAYKHGNSLIWESRYASQIAVHEFRKHCKKTLDDTKGSIIPSNSIWKPYIKLLGQCNYQDEIGEIIGIWEDLKVVPERETIAMLLASMPDGFAQVILKHAQTHLEVLKNEDDDSNIDLEQAPTWDWPEDYEVNYWKARIKRLP